MRVLALLGVLVITGCTYTLNGRLYDLDSGDLLTATYQTNGSGKGPIWIGPSKSTADCRGEYVTVARGATGWGTIYRGTSPSTVVTTVSETDQMGSAVVTCRDSRVIECEYVTSTSGSGSGHCRDNRNRRYRLMF